VQRLVALVSIAVQQMAALPALVPVDRNLPVLLPVGVVLPLANLNYASPPGQLGQQATLDWRAWLPFLSKVYKEYRAPRLHVPRTVMNRKYL